jgi:hypothetical protein
MTRYTLFLLIVAGSTASAIAAVAPAQRNAIEPAAKNITVIEKNQAFPTVGPMIVDQCGVEDCSDTPI